MEEEREGEKGEDNYLSEEMLVMSLTVPLIRSINTISDPVTNVRTWDTITITITGVESSGTGYGGGRRDE